VTAALSQAVTTEQVAEVIVTQGVRAMGAHAGAFYQLTQHGRSIEIVRVVGYPERSPAPSLRPLAIPAWAVDAIHDREPAFFGSEHELRSRYPDDVLAHRPSSGAAWAGVPLIVGARAIGVLVLTFARPRDFAADEQELILGVTRQCAQAFDRARLFGAERVAHGEAELTAHRTARLQALTAALSEALTPAQVADAIVGQGTAALGARAGSMSLVSDDGRMFELVRAVGYPDEFVTRWHRTPVSTRIVPEEAVRTSLPVFLESKDALAVGYGPVANPWATLPDRGARAIVPLIVRRRVLGVLSFLFPEPKAFPEEERAFILTLARQCAQALERARLYEREHRVAETLQRAFLPGSLPRVPGCEIHTAYVAGRAESEVGGDWYDVFELPDGRVVMSVGDVVGRGLRAAAIMGQVRQSIRAAALDGHDPAAVFDRVGKLLRLAPEQDGVAAAVFGIFDPGSLTFTYAAAGHPAPIIADGDDVEFLPTGGALLGLEPRTPPTWTVTLPSNGMLVLYTDGLIEATHDPLAGEAALLSAVRDELRHPSADRSRAILARVVGDIGAPDDIAIVAVSLAAAPVDALTLVLPASPASHRLVRQSIRRFGAAAALGRERVDDLTLAVGEAVNNAIRHAYTAPGVVVRVWARRDGGGVRAEIADEGRWRAERADAYGGRGLQIMREIVEGLEIATTSAGTTVTLFVSLGEADQGVVGAARDQRREGTPGCPAE